MGEQTTEFKRNDNSKKDYSHYNGMNVVYAKYIVKGKTPLDNLPETYLVLIGEGDSPKDFAKALNILAIEKDYEVVSNAIHGVGGYSHHVIMKKISSK